MNQPWANVLEDLTEAELRRQFHADFSPIGWHWGHVAWQAESWIWRRYGGRVPLRPELDGLFDSFRSRKEERGSALPSLAALRGYVDEVAEAVARLARERSDDPRLVLLWRLVANHERQHLEIVLIIRLLAALYVERRASPVWAGREASSAWVTIEGGEFSQGCARPDPELADADLDAWDNECPGHRVRVETFRLQRFPVSEEEWLSWMEEGGYDDARLWSKAGWAWKTHNRIQAPEHWQRSREGQWWRRTLGGLVPAGGSRPVAHVSWFEADAYARSQAARLPSEVEWEYAASTSPKEATKRRFPWGDHFDAARADIGWRESAPFSRGAHPAGASAWGVEDLCGGVWEWVADAFRPYPGFEPGWYAEYSEPWFGSGHRVARGGSWLTAPANARTTFRNWYEPRVREPCLGVRLARDA